MIHKIIVPKLAANMEKGIIGKWLKKEGDKVEKGEPLYELSTDKAVFEVEAEESGFLRKILVEEGIEAPILASIGIIAQKEEKLPPLNELETPLILGKEVEEAKVGFVKKEEKPKGCPIIILEKPVRASPRARNLAKEKGIELSLIKGTGPEGRIIEEDIKNYLLSRKERILIIGGGDGAMLVKDILNRDKNKAVIGILDDRPKLWGKEILGVQVYGPLKMVDQLKDMFDALIISFTRDTESRRKIFVEYKNKGYKFINIIHPQALVENNVELGEGNLIYAFARIGPFSKVGDNNLISAFTNIEHHNKIGSHNHFGPHCSTSGEVRIEDGCKFGTGIFIQDSITIGKNVWVASGSIIINDIPSNSALKIKVIQKPEPRKN